MEHLENDGVRVCVAMSRGAVDVWLGWLGALLYLVDSGEYSCSLRNAGRKLLLTENSVEAQTGHKNYAARDGRSPGYFFIGTGGVSAYPYVTSGSRMYIDYHCERKMLLRRALVMEEIRFRRCLFSWATGMFSTERVSRAEVIALGTKRT